MPSRFFILIILLFLQITSNLSQTDYEKLSSLSLEELMNFEVYTANKEYEKLKDIPASVVIISREDIKNFGYQSISDILRNVTGLYAIEDYGEIGMNFGFRGFWSLIPNDNIVIMINNVPQTKNVYYSHALNQIDIPVEAIDHIEIVRGPMSVLYGSGAFFGAINIITNSNPDTKNYISLNYGSRNTKKLALRIEKNIEDLYFSINTSLYKTDGINQPFYKMVSDPSILNNYNVGETDQTEKTLSKNQKFLNLNIKYEEFSFDLNLSSALTGLQFTAPVIGDGHAHQADDFNLSFLYSKKTTKDFSVDFRATYMKDRAIGDFNFFFEDFYGYQQLESAAYELQLDLNYKLNKNLSLKSGLYYKDIFRVSNRLNLPSFGSDALKNRFVTIGKNQSIITEAFFAQFKYIFLDKFTLHAGLRLEKTPEYDMVGEYNMVTPIQQTYRRKTADTKLKFIPRIALQYKINNTNSLKFLFGTAVNSPSFYQNYLELDKSSDPVISLESEEITTYEINYLSSFSKNYSINFSLFHNTLDKLISRIILIDDNGNYLSSYNSNSGLIKTYGLEFTFKFKPHKKFFGEISTSYHNTKHKTKELNDLKVGYSPEYIHYLKFGYKPIENLIITSNTIFVGGMESYWDNSQTAGNSIYTPVGRIGEKAPSYLLVSLHICYKNFITPNTDVYLKVNNLFDKDIYYPTTNNNRWADKGTMDYSRVFYFGIGYKF